MKFITIFWCFFSLTLLFSQDESFQKLKEELRGELIKDIDQKLSEVRQEMIEKIDQRLSGMQQQGYLGVSLKEISAGLRTLLDLEKNEGVLVVTVEANGPAAKAGLQEMDIILSWQGQSVGSPEKLNELVKATTPGTVAKVSVLQKREKKTIDLNVGGKFYSQEKTSPIESLFNRGKGKDLNTLLEKQLDEMFGHLPKEEKEMLKDMQKSFKEQFENLQKNPESLKDLSKNLEELLKEVMPNQKNRNDDHEEESIDDLLDDLMGDSKSYLGMFFIPIPDPLKQKENYSYDHGVLISEVESGSAAKKAGVRKWEILMEINGEKITSPKQAKELISSLSGKNIEMLIFSQGEMRKVSIK